MNKIKALAIFNALSLIAQLTVVWLTGQKSIHQQDVGDVSARYESLFTPAGITFSIWGIIYLSLSLFCLYHTVTAYKHDRTHAANTTLLQMSGLFIVLNLSGAAWMIVWVQEYLFASVILILLQLICLIVIHIRLNIYDPQQASEIRFATHIPMSIYLGWISVATVANIAAWLTTTGWDGAGFSGVQWTVIMICVVILLSLIMILFRRNVYFGLTVAWALYGIILKRDVVETQESAPIITAAWMGIGIIIIVSIIQLSRNLTRRKKAIVFPAQTASLK